jgi:prevent-host-death family protein
MLKLTTTEAREVLSELVNRAAFGQERVILTRHGKELAVLISIADLERLLALEQRKPARPAPGHTKSLKDRAGVVTKGRAALKALQKGAVARGANKLTDEDVDAEIGAARKARRHGRGLS